MHRMRFTYALHARSACSKAGLRACVRACMNHAVMDGWIDGACSRQSSLGMHARRRRRRRRSGLARPAGGRGPGLRAAERARGCCWTHCSLHSSTPPMHHSVIHCRPRRAGQPLRTHVPAGPRARPGHLLLPLWSAACRYGTGRGHACGAGRPAGRSPCMLDATPRQTAARARHICRTVLLLRACLVL
jgi:hypothetical protein